MPSSAATRPEPELLAHELIFGGFLAVTWARLVAAAGPLASPALVYALFIAGAVAVAAYHRARPTETRWRLRLAYYPILMNIVFVHLQRVVPLIHPALVDSLLQHWDRALLGGDLSLAVTPVMSPLVAECLSVCYCLFFVYLVLSVVRYLRAPLSQAKAFIAGLFALYGIGFLGYTLMPAQGPYAALADAFPAPLHGYLATRVLMAVYPLGTNGADVFPSLHCAVTAFILGFDAGHAPRRALRWLVPVVGLWISTICLRFHYAVDVAAGLALGAACLAFVYRPWTIRENRHALHPAAH